MTERRYRHVRGLLGLTALFIIANGCGLTASSGDGGSETHWLAQCGTSSDCAVGQCLCGVCTEPCSIVLDCPAPLDACSTEGDSPETACELAICRSSSAAAEITAALGREQRTESCDAGRPTALIFSDEHEAVIRAKAIGERGFMIWTPMWERGNILRLNAAGRIMRKLAPPSDMSPRLNDMAPAVDGSTTLTGTVDGFDGRHGWLGKVDSDWNLLWEWDIAEPNGEHIESVTLDDGSTIVAYQRELTPGAPDEITTHSMELYWARVAVDGAPLWERRIPFSSNASTGRAWIYDKGRTLALMDSGELRIVFDTVEGLQLIAGTVNGEGDARPLGLSLPHIVQVSALPGERLAIATGSISSVTPAAPAITVLDGAGNLLWQREYVAPDAKGRTPRMEAFAYNGGRQELVMVGRWGAIPGAPPEAGGAGGSWMLAATLDGEPTWQLARDAAPVVDFRDTAGFGKGQGPALTHVAAAPDGSLLATGESDYTLAYMLVGAGSCETDAR